MNFGFISRANDLTSSTVSARSLSEYPVNYSTVSVHPLVFLSYVVDKIMDAAAI